MILSSLHCSQLILWLDRHCVKIVHIRSFSGLYFTAFGLNTERYGPNLSVFSLNAGKYVPEKHRIRTLCAVSTQDRALLWFAISYTGFHQTNCKDQGWGNTYKSWNQKKMPNMGNVLNFCVPNTFRKCIQVVVHNKHFHKGFSMRSHSYFSLKLSMLEDFCISREAFCWLCYWQKSYFVWLLFIYERFFPFRWKKGIKFSL